MPECPGEEFEKPGRERLSRTILKVIVFIQNSTSIGHVGYAFISVFPLFSFGDSKLSYENFLISFYKTFWREMKYIFFEKTPLLISSEFYFCRGFLKKVHPVICKQIYNLPSKHLRSLNEKAK